MATRTITLTDRPPVTIQDDDWDVIAKATDSEHDGQVECQANRKSEWSIRVRQHADGRVIVSAVYAYVTHWQNARCLAHRHGVLLTATPTTEKIIGAIKSTAAKMEQGEHNGSDGDRWAQLADDCIADLPAEVI